MRGLSLPPSLSLSLRAASRRKRAGGPTLAASRSFPRSLVLSLSLSPSLSRPRGERNLQHCNPGRGTKIHSREDSGRQRRSRTFTAGHSRRSRDFVRLVRRSRWRDEETARIEERKREREREKGKGRGRHSPAQDRHESADRWESCAAPSCRLRGEKKATC